MADAVRFFDGGLKVDTRGSVSFVNGFAFEKVKRFYIVRNRTTKIVRAFHGHMKEAKYALVLSGSILLCVVKLTNSHKPSKRTTVKKIVLRASKPQVVYIPPGYANGFQALERGSTVMFFSTRTLAQSLKDDFRFPADYWGDVWR